MATSKLNKGLGRGLDALLIGNKDQSSDALRDVQISQLRPGKYQPRIKMDEESLVELASSIKTQGIMQPILARELSKGEYEIIAGERRWRAAKLVGLTQVPVLIRDVPDSAALTMAIIENIQREDLNSLEQAVGIQRLIDEFQMTHQEAADAVGRSRSAASNLLRLLKLPESVQQMLSDNKIDMGHARALLSLEPGLIIATANKIILEQLSVRDAEKLVNALLSAPLKQKKPSINRDLLNLQEELSQTFGTAVIIKSGKRGTGKLIIDYSSNSHLDEIIARLK